MHATGKDDIVVDIEMWDLAGDIQKGPCLAKGSLQLSWHSWKQGEVVRKIAELKSPKQVGETNCALLNSRPSALQGIHTNNWWSRSISYLELKLQAMRPDQFLIFLVRLRPYPDHATAIVVAIKTISLISFWIPRSSDSR